MTAHHCHAIGCTKAIPPRFAMCPRHWSMVRPRVRALVWRCYRPGQEKDKRPTLYYRAALRLARAIVAFREKRLQESEAELAAAVELADRARGRLVVDARAAARAAERDGKA